MDSVGKADYAAALGRAASLSTGTACGITTGGGLARGCRAHWRPATTVLGPASSAAARLPCLDQMGFHRRRIAPRHSHGGLRSHAAAIGCLRVPLRAWVTLGCSSKMTKPMGGRPSAASFLSAETRIRSCDATSAASARTGVVSGADSRR